MPLAVAKSLSRLKKQNRAKGPVPLWIYERLRTTGPPAEGPSLDGFFFREGDYFSKRIDVAKKKSSRL